MSKQTSNTVKFFSSSNGVEKSVTYTIHNDGKNITETYRREEKNRSKDTHKEEKGEAINEKGWTVKYFVKGRRTERTMKKMPYSKIDRDHIFSGFKLFKDIAGENVTTNIMKPLNPKFKLKKSLIPIKHIISKDFQEPEFGNPRFSSPDDVDSLEYISIPYKRESTNSSSESGELIDSEKSPDYPTA